MECKKCNFEMEKRYKTPEAFEEAEGRKPKDFAEQMNNSWDEHYKRFGEPYWCPNCEIIRFVEEIKENEK